jgi:hypothetical protein
MRRYREVGINEAVPRYPMWGNREAFSPFSIKGRQQGRQRRNSDFVQFNFRCGLETSVTVFFSGFSSKYYPLFILVIKNWLKLDGNYRWVKQFLFYVT